MANNKASKTHLPETPQLGDGLSRREFLTGVGTVAFSAALTTLPQRADAFRSLTAFWKRNAAGGGGSSSGNGSDPYWDYVALLMQFDGTNGSTVFADESNVGKTPTILGSPYVDTSAGSSPYSGKVGSVVFNGSTDRISYADHADFEVTGDFTAEVWIKTTSTSTGQLVFGKDPNSGSTWASYNFSITNSGTWRFSVSTNNSGQDLNATFGSITANTWYHAAIVRSSGSWSVYINGTRLYGPTSTGNPYDGSGGFVIGQEINTAQTSWFSGRMADLRIYKGLAKYTANFTPSTTPQGLGSANDSYWGYCVLACPFENSLKDMSGKLATYSGTTTLATAAKKFGTAAAGFNGTNSRVSVAQNTDFAFGSGNFTVELWVNFSSTSDSHVIGAHAWGTSSNWVLAYRSGQLVVNLNSSDYIAYTWTPTLGTWYHIAFTRSANNIQLFIGGALVGTASFSSSIGNSYPLTIGAPYNDTKYFSGYIDSFRITKGYARYVSNFTPPTAAFPVGKDESVDPFWTNTVLAMHMENFTDASSRHTFTSSSALTSTTSLKYGTRSADFTPASSQISTGSSTDLNLDGDFTIEFFICPTVSLAGVNRTFLCVNQSGGAQIGWNHPNGIGICRNNVGWDYTVMWNHVANAWYHLAFVRQGTTAYIFANGVLLGTGTSSSTFTSSSALSIGAKSDGSENTPCFVDDLRITKGVARYVQSFTPPTQAFATTQYTTGSGSIVTSGLVCHIDAGNNSSYGGSGTAWSNLVSSPADGSAQSAYNLKMGDGSTSSTYPTFIGVAGGLKANDYFSVDGGDFFCLSGSNTAFVNSIHKAGANFTIEAMVYFVGATTRVHLGVTENYGTWGYGFWFEINSTNKLVFGCVNNSTTVFSKVSDNTFIKNTWNHVAISLTDGGTGFFYLNGNYLASGSSSTWSSSYTGTGTTDASRTLSLFGIQAAASTYADSGNRLAIWRMYNRALSKSELDQNWNATRARFGL